ncbi:heavy metal-binding domain-containing protein [bacterium]|nr:heavy metal-binding domain-containing protein [bacterium]
MEDLFQLIVTAVLLLLGFFFGSRNEKKHFKSIIEREKQLIYIPLRADQALDRDYHEAKLVSGSVVIANDYFKTFVAGLKTMVGGKLNSYESLMDRARREAVIRMKEQARAWGAKEIVHFRLESSALDQLGVEILAVATALK